MTSSWTFTQFVKLKTLVLDFRLFQFLDFKKNNGERESISLWLWIYIHRFNRPEICRKFSPKFFRIFFFKNSILAFTGAFQFFTRVFRIYDSFLGVLKFFCEYRQSDTKHRRGTSSVVVCESIKNSPKLTVTSLSVSKLKN